MSGILMEIGLILACILFQAYFAGMETGVISVNKLRVQHALRNNIPGARPLDFFIRNPDHLFSTTLVGTNLFMVLISVLAADLSFRTMGDLGPAVSGILITFIDLVFAEYLPKAWFRSKPVERTMLLIQPLYWIRYLFHPVGNIVVIITRMFIPDRKNKRGTRPIVTRDEIVHLSTDLERTGSLMNVKSEMIQNVMNLSHKSCLHAMTPAKHVVFVNGSMPREQFISLVRMHDFKRYPVYEHDRYNITGIIHVFDVLFDTKADPSTPIATYKKPALFVPPQLAVDDALTLFRSRNQPVALVKKEHSDQVIGLLSVENILDDALPARTDRPR
ncbi:MAG: DUF21 domain-containing protein [Spartobacteria bacterium]|nr:DUF21 domain-containing protein [Spartobacteria bacterium]